MKKIFLTSLGMILALFVMSQDSTVDLRYPQAKWSVMTAGSSTKLVTDYPAVYEIVTARYSDSLKYVTIQYKKDRIGAYRRFIIYLKGGMEQGITDFLSSPINKQLINK